MTDPQAGVEDVPPGYKRTDVGAIPEDWSVSLLDSVAVRGSGHTPDKKHPEYWDGSIPWISLADSPELDNGYIYETTSTITPAGIQNSSAVIHPPETVVLTRDAGVGKSAIMGQAMAVSQHFMAWRCGPDINNHFLYYWLQSKKGEFERIAIGNTIKTIGLPYFKNLKIPLPHIHEQCAIAAALSDVDGLIGALDALIEKKRAIKQAAMQQLLTGKTRLPGFEGQWEVIHIRDLLIYERPDRYIVKSTDYSEQGDFPVLTANKSFILGYTTENFGVCREIPVMIFDDFTTDSKFVNVPFKVKSSAIKILRTKHDQVDLQFVFTRMQLINFPVGNHKRHYIPEYQNLEFATPDYDEQTAIAAVLSDMDAGIAALERRREKAAQIKQGMMQQLLTGRIRLPSVGGVSTQ